MFIFRTEPHKSQNRIWPLEWATNLRSGGSCNEEYSKVARDFNRKLQGLADKLNRNLPGMRIAYCNLYDVVLQVVENPSSYGKLDSTIVYNTFCGMNPLKLAIKFMRKIWECRGGVLRGWSARDGLLVQQEKPINMQRRKQACVLGCLPPTERMSQFIANHIMDKDLIGFLWVVIHNLWEESVKCCAQDNNLSEKKSTNQAETDAAGDVPNTTRT